MPTPTSSMQQAWSLRRAAVRCCAVWRWTGRGKHRRVTECDRPVISCPIKNLSRASSYLGGARRDINLSDRSIIPPVWHPWPAGTDGALFTSGASATHATPATEALQAGLVNTHTLNTSVHRNIYLCLGNIRHWNDNQFVFSPLKLSKFLLSLAVSSSYYASIFTDATLRRQATSVSSSSEKLLSDGDFVSEETIPPMTMKKAFHLVVKTGDQEGAGTDANVFVVLEDEKGLVTPSIKLDKIFYNDLERSKRDTYNVECPMDFGSVKYLRLSRDTKGIADDWFCDYIHVEDHRKPKKKISKDHGTKSKKNFLGSKYLQENSSTEKGVYFFPIHRWIAPKHDYLFHEYAVCLPQHDPCLGPRKADLERKRNAYTYIVHAAGMVAQIENLPSDEKFSEEYYWTFATEKINLLARTKLIEWTTSKWNTLEDLKKVYKQCLGEPECIDVWKEDWWFGIQRLQGVNPNIISLCNKIPENFDVTEDTVKGLLDDISLAEALENNKIFICDLEITDNLECKDDRDLASPLALFYLNKQDKLMPIAIQLKQARGHDNPVYTPNDPPNTWLVAKMFYNNTEAQHHQALTHLGYTHLLMEGVVICTHRNLSPSHPLFKLMAPHFLFLLAINTRGLEKLVSPGGWVDTCMTQGVKGIFELMKRGFDRWRFDREGQIEKELESRGVLDKNVLPYYPYRDDGIPLYHAIKKYVTAVVTHHYDTPEKLSEDWELKWWRKELVTARDNNGVGLQNVPGDCDGFNSVDEVIDVVTVIIATCSLGHAAANFQQYEQYAFVPNYPGILLIDVPKEKKDYTEKELMAILPHKRMTLDIMVITKLLSSRGTNSLGNFEMQYLYDPVGVKAAEEFQKDLKRLSLDMKKRNIDREWKFEWLDPEIVPNSISV